MKTITNKLLTLPAAATLLAGNIANAQNLLVNGNFNTSTVVTNLWNNAANWVNEDTTWTDRDSTSSYGNTWNDDGEWNASISTSAYYNEVISTNNGVVKIHSQDQWINDYAASNDTADIFSDVISGTTTSSYNLSGFAGIPSRNVIAGSLGSVGYQEVDALGNDVGSFVTLLTVNSADWVDFSESFTIASGNDFKIAFGLDTDTSGSQTLIVDSLNLTSVPEPSSALLLSLGSLGLVVRRKRA